MCEKIHSKILLKKDIITVGKLLYLYDSIKPTRNQYIFIVKMMKKEYSIWLD